MDLFKQLSTRLPGYKSIREAIDKNISPVSATGLSHIHRALLIHALAEDKVDLVITGSEAEAKKLCDDINMMAGREEAVLFPSKELVLTPVEGANREYEYMRISALSRALSGDCSVICGSIEAVMQPVIPPGVLTAASLELKVGQEIDLRQFAAELSRSGYQRCEKVEGASQFSIRGDILDIFPVQADRPIRAELFGDEVETMAEFDTDSQRRFDEHLDSVLISPASEILYDSEELADKIEALMKKVRGKHMEQVREHLGADVRRLRAGEILVHGQKYAPLVYGEPTTVIDYISGNVLYSDHSDILANANAVMARYSEDVKILLEEGQLCKGLDGYVLELPVIQNIAAKKVCIYMSTFLQGGDRVDFRRLVSFEAMQTAGWGGELSQLTEDLTDFRARGYSMIICAGSDKTLPIIQQDIEESGIPCSLARDGAQLAPGRAILMSGSLSGGFEFPEIKTVLITQGRSLDTVRKTRRKKKTKAEEIRSLSDIAEGDLIVHSTHGIGRFIGIRKLEFDGVTKDYITIQYAGTDKLYIPVTQLDMVSKYIGPRDDSGVKLNKLSSNDWQKTRSNVKRAVKDMAKELIALYAKREQSKGFPFYPDDEIQHDFEDRFPYVIECMLQAQPDGYMNLTLKDRYPIAQKYGAYQEDNGPNNNHAAAIIFTPNPIVVVVMTRNVGMFQDHIAAFGGFLADYALELDEKLAEREATAATPESSPEPTPEPTAEPTAEPSPEPTPLPTPEASEAPAPEPSPVVEQQAASPLALYGIPVLLALAALSLLIHGVRRSRRKVRGHR